MNQLIDRYFFFKFFFEIIEWHIELVPEDFKKKLSKRLAMLQTKLNKIKELMQPEKSPNSLNGGYYQQATIDYEATLLDLTAKQLLVRNFMFKETGT